MRYEPSACSLSWANCKFSPTRLGIVNTSGAELVEGSAGVATGVAEGLGSGGAGVTVTVCVITAGGVVGVLDPHPLTTPKEARTATAQIALRCLMRPPAVAPITSGRDPLHTLRFFGLPVNRDSCLSSVESDPQLAQWGASSGYIGHVLGS